MIRNGQSSTKLISGIDVSGFAAVMLFLVCLFMLPAGMHMREPPTTIPVDLPKVVHPRSVPHARREDAISISLTWNGDVFFGYDRVSSDMLHERICNAVKSGSEGVVYINADARAKYKDVETVVNEVALSGVHSIVFLAYEKRKP